MKQKRWLDQVGPRLSRQALWLLKERGIFVQAAVRLEHQHLAKRYEVRGLESGGAVGDVGRYVTFTQEDGQPLEWLHPVEVIGVKRFARRGNPSHLKAPTRSVEEVPSCNIVS